METIRGKVFMKIFCKFEELRDGLIGQLAEKYFKDKRVLDVGCGRGERTKLFYQHSNKVYGLDLADKLETNDRKNFCFIRASAENLPFTDNYFDGVVSFDVIEHLENDARMLSEAYRVLKKGGRLFLGTPNRGRLSRYLYWLAGRKIQYPYQLGPGIIHLREYTMAELADLLQRESFQIERQESIYLGLVGKVNRGLRLFPEFMEKYCQYLLIIARK